MVQLLPFLLVFLIPGLKPCLQENVPLCINNIPQIEKSLKLADKFINHPVLDDTLFLIDQAKPLIAHQDYLANSSSIILLQNNTEIRPTGGFIGSYAVATPANHSSDGGQNPSSEVVQKNHSSEVIPMKNIIGSSSDGGILPTISFNDIYVPDGQVRLTGHVEPPPAIQAAFEQGEFRLVDANFEPDFPTSASNLRWFFEKGGEVDPDLLIAVNLSTIQKVLALTGTFTVDQYNIQITPDNAYALLQNQAEIDFFPGSTQKKDALSAVGKALFTKINSLPLAIKIKLAKLLVEELNNGEILIHSTNQSFQELLVDKSWAGQFPTGPDPVGQDFFAAVETNLGANKANAFISRQTNHLITNQDHQVTITYKNSSPFENPTPPRFYGGNYINYLRLYIPSTATNIKFDATPIPDNPDFSRFKDFPIQTTQKYGLTQISLFHITPANGSSQINLSYDLPSESEGYSLTLYHQPGIKNDPHHLNLFGQIQQADLQKTTTLN